MSSKGTQRINATDNINKNDVANRFKELKKLIQSNSNVPFKEAIKKIASIDVGTFNNYIYPGRQMGRVSLYTIENLSRYFDLPKEVFTSQAPLDENIKTIIISKLNENLNADTISQDLNSTLTESQSKNCTPSILSIIKNVTIDLNNESDTETLKKAIKLLELSLNISNNRLNTLLELDKM